ncbi:MAG: putative porin [Bacteroidales bacterium]|nr:putative porin [Bacteroidales bacterium]
MSLLKRIWFPAAVLAVTTAGVLGAGGRNAYTHGARLPAEAGDTVIYPEDGYKLRRHGDFVEQKVIDTTGSFDVDVTEVIDTLPHLTARDTIPVPDSLRLTDPFRFKYYVALIDSLTHVIVRDSLRRTSDSLKVSCDTLFARGDTLMARRDSLHARLDSLDWRKIDSIYVADSAALALAKHLAWYNSLSRKERRKYDLQQLIPIKMAEMDSLRKLKEERKAIRDSIIEFTPRILETYALPDSMQYKRILCWTLDTDFQKIKAYEPDTTYNAHYYDYPFQNRDVNASWLGVAGSPVQYYDFFKRKSDEGVVFYDAQESWSFSPRTLVQYNTKSPHTELAYWGTLLAGDTKESDNLHIFTTQNITPALNFQLLYNRFGGGGILTNENTENKTYVAGLNYLGKKYTGHLNYIHNTVTRGENGGVQENRWIRDTVVDSREIAVHLLDAASTVKKNTVSLNQELRFPLDFAKRIRARRDSSFHYEPDSLDKDISTAFIGHSSEWSNYTRTYTDKVTTNAGKAFFHDAAAYGTASQDSLRVMKLDNKVFIKLQPWKSDAIVSKLNVGVGDYLKLYAAQTYDETEKSLQHSAVSRNSLYAYAGAEGQIRQYVHWDAKGQFVFGGYDAGNFQVEANAGLNFYPFRRARKSPVSIGAHFETSLLKPDYYHEHLFTNRYCWENEFERISTTRIEGDIDIPRWRLHTHVGYALLGNNLYFDTQGMVQQNREAMSVLSASLRKDFKLGPVHLDNRALLQFSSNEDVMPLPLLALNLRYYVQFVVQRDPTKTQKIMEMQFGINAFYNTPWYAPGWNPVLGVFHNQHDNLYTNGPFFDVFANVQWKRACIFIKWENAGKGWPMQHRDYFSADHYIVTQSSIKFGIFWPFHLDTARHTTVSR